MVAHMQIDSSSLRASPEPGPDQEIAATYRRYLAGVVSFHLAAAEACGLGPTDYQASSVLDLDGPMATGNLAEELALSPSATTRVVDRLIASGLARRVPDPADRRRVLVEHTGHLPAELGQILGMVRGPIGEVVDDLSGAQVRGLDRYFTEAGRIYRDAARQVHDPAGGRSPS